MVTAKIVDNDKFATMWIQRFCRETNFEPPVPVVLYHLMARWLHFEELIVLHAQENELSLKRINVDALFEFKPEKDGHFWSDDV